MAKPEHVYNIFNSANHMTNSNISLHLMLESYLLSHIHPIYFR